MASRHWYLDELSPITGSVGGSCQHAPRTRTYPTLPAGADPACCARLAAALARASFGGRLWFAGAARPAALAVIHTASRGAVTGRVAPSPSARDRPRQGVAGVDLAEHPTGAGEEGCPRGPGGPPLILPQHMQIISAGTPPAGPGARSPDRELVRPDLSPRNLDFRVARGVSRGNLTP